MDWEMVCVLYRRSHEHLREVECRMKSGWIRLEPIIFQGEAATVSANCFLLPAVFEKLAPINKQ